MVTCLSGIVIRMLEDRPALAYRKGVEGTTILEVAVLLQDHNLLKILLEFDPKLAYITNEKTGSTAFFWAARLGCVSIAEEIRSVCPDSIYIPDKDGNSILHEAVNNEQLDFIDYIVRTPQLQGLINQANNVGNLPLHEAADKCNPKLLHLLLSHPQQDHSAVNNRGLDAKGINFINLIKKKTLKGVSLLLLLVLYKVKKDDAF